MPGEQVKRKDYLDALFGASGILLSLLFLGSSIALIISGPSSVTMLLIILFGFSGLILGFINTFGFERYMKKHHPNDWNSIRQNILFFSTYDISFFFFMFTIKPSDESALCKYKVNYQLTALFLILFAILLLVIAVFGPRF